MTWILSSHLHINTCYHLPIHWFKRLKKCDLNTQQPFTYQHMLSLATNHVDNHLQNSSIKSSLGTLLKSSRLKWKWAKNDKLILNSKAPVKYEIFILLKYELSTQTQWNSCMHTWKCTYWHQQDILCAIFCIWFKGALNTKYLGNTLTDMISLCTYAVIFFWQLSHQHCEKRLKSCWTCLYPNGLCRWCISKANLVFDKEAICKSSRWEQRMAR